MLMRIFQFLEGAVGQAYIPALITALGSVIGVLLTVTINIIFRVLDRRDAKKERENLFIQQNILRLQKHLVPLVQLISEFQDEKIPVLQSLAGHYFPPSKLSITLSQIRQLVFALDQTINNLNPSVKDSSFNNQLLETQLMMQNILHQISQPTQMADEPNWDELARFSKYIANKYKVGV